MYGAMKQHLAGQLDEIKNAGLYQGRAYSLHGPAAPRRSKGRHRRSQHVCE